MLRLTQRPETVKSSDDNVKDGLDLDQLPQDDEPTLAQQIDKSVWFHTLYGTLDGLTVSYSTVKFLCDVSSKTNNIYHSNLENLLTDSTWLPILLFETSFITLLSLIGNRAAKQKDPNTFQRFCRDYWPYIRDVLRGAKNGYRGVKSLFAALYHLNILNAEDLRNIAIPIGLAVGAIGLLNRIFIRHMSNQRKTLFKRLNEIEEKLSAYDERAFLKKENELIDKLKNHQAEQAQDAAAKIETELDTLKRKKAAAFQQFQADLALYETLSNDIKIFENSIKHRFLYAANVIGAIVDGPYLYAGILLLGSIPPPFMAITATILLSMFVGLVATRIHDEFNYRKDLKIQSLKTQLLVDQKKYDSKLCQFEAALNALGERAKDERVISRLIQEFELMALYQAYLNTDNALNHLLAPSYRDAVLSGVKDGLCLFGAISTIYFSIGIFLFLSGTAFPPALIVAGAFIGLAAMMVRTAQRVNQTTKDKANFQTHIRQKKQAETHQEPFLSYINDCNNDGFTKGQFYFQETFEVVRSLGAGPYKSNNLTDFMLSSLKEDDHGGNKKDSLPMIIFCGATSIIYGLCLAIRAFGQGFSKHKQQTSKQSAPAQQDNIVVCKKPRLQSQTDFSPPSPEKSPPDDKTMRSLTSSRHAFFHKTSSSSLPYTTPLSISPVPDKEKPVIHYQKRRTQSLSALAL